MKKRSIFSRIAILNEGRKAFLDYLKNITPQTVLLSMSLLSAYKNTLLPQNKAGLIFLSAAFFFTFAAACYANITLFYQYRFGNKLEEHNTRIHQLCKAMKYNRSRRLIIAAILTTKHKWVELIEQACTVVILQITLAALILLAMEHYSQIMPATK